MDSRQSRVLVVDDDAALRGLLHDALIDEGYEALAVDSGRAALAALQSWRPRLIVLDLRLRDMNGGDFLAAIRAAGFSELPILILTAMTMTEGEVEALGAPVLCKPFELENLLETISLMLASQDAASGSVATEV